MKKLIALLPGLCLALACFAQNNFSCIVKNAETREPLPNVSIAGRGFQTRITNDKGEATLSVPNGKSRFLFSCAGFESTSLELTFPLAADSVFSIEMTPMVKEMEEVIISTSRIDSRIENTPTRVEVLGTEEVDEESGVKPGHVASLLGDVAGIQSQQTSAVTGNTDLRIQGLPGDYTQLLRDGIPLFGSYAGSFSILEIPPLDLKQIEIVKGASSTLYGGGAIAGIINIISKKPQQGVKERFLLLNQSSLKESNFNLYLSERRNKVGYTFFGGGTYQNEADVNKDGFSDVPRTESIFFHPTLFFYPGEKSTISLGLNGTFEERKGGDMLVLKRVRDSQHQFFIQNSSYRNTLDIVWDNRATRFDKFTLKGTVSAFSRDINTNVFGMKARQISWFSEASYVKKLAKHDWVMGLNLNGESFKKKLPDSTRIRNYDHFTLGLFVQDDWRIHPKFILETGFRSDFHNRYGSFLLPRVSLLYKISPSWTARLGGGLGYKIPTVFESDIDERDYPLLQPMDTIKAERSFGANCDVNYKKQIGEVELTINQSFYITQIDDPIVRIESPTTIRYSNAARPVVTRGIETWVMISYAGLEAYLGYTLTDARKNYDALHPYLELSARNKFASVISYEFSPRFRACIEAAFTGRQYLEDGTQSPSFPFVAGMIRYDIDRLSFVLNCENFFDYRQTRKESIIIPPVNNPRFKQLWAPIDGRIVNLSMKIRL